MRVVVTGAAGFLGSHVCERLVEHGHEVLGVDAFTDFYDSSLKRRTAAWLSDEWGIEVHERDVLDSGLPDELRGAAAVCHLAGLPGVRCRDPQRLESGNVESTRRVIRAAAAAGVHRVLLASSSSVYAPAGAAIREEAPLEPLSAYGRSKQSAERVAAELASESGLELVVLRYFTVYGPRQRPDMAFARFLSALRSGEAMPLFGGGAQRRDFTYAADAAEATALALERGRPGAAYNVSGGRSVELSHALSMLASEAGSAPLLSDEPANPEEHDFTEADLSLAQRELGYRPSVSLEDGIARQVAATPAVAPA
jgi:nucleoside-diphosphate-sugar epimerase